MLVLGSVLVFDKWFSMINEDNGPGLCQPDKVLVNSPSVLVVSQDKV